MTFSLLRKFGLVLAIAVASVLSFCGAPARAQEMQYPLAVVQTANQVTYVADRNLPGIWKIEGGQASVYFQGSKKFRTPLNAVRCLALDAQGTLYAGDTSTREIYKFDAEGKPQPMTKGYIGIPMGIVIDSKGNLFVADLERQCIFQVTAAGEVSEFVKIQGPRGIAIDKQDRLWVLTNTGDSLVRFSPDKTKEVLVAGTPFQFTNQIVVDDAFNAYFCDGYAHAVVMLAPGGQPKNLATGEPLNHPVGITLVGKQIMVADPHAKSIFSLSTEGESKIERFYPR